MRAHAALALAALLAAVSPEALEAQAGIDIILNGGFEAVGQGGLPEGWSYGEWLEGRSRRGLVPGGHSGELSFSMSCDEENDLKLIQEVRLRPGALYRISAWTRGRADIPDRKGMNISGLDISETSDYLIDTGGQWREIIVYARAGKKQTSFRLSLRLGGYFSTTTGEAQFDDVSMVEVETAPAGAKVISLVAPKASSGSMPAPTTEALVLGLFLAGALGLWLLLERSRAAPALDSKKSFPWPLIALTALALAARLPFCFGGYGHPTDLATFKAWAAQAASGLFSFYKDSVFADYPPGYVYVLALLGGLRSLLGLGHDSPLFELIIRLPALCADIGLGILIYRRALPRSGASRALLLSALFLLNPVSVQNSAVWGQVDSVLALLAFASIQALQDRKPARAGILYALATLVKPQALLLAPVFLLAFADWRRIKDILLCVGTGLAALLAGCLPYMITEGPLFPFRLYASTLGSYAYGSVNAANAWALAGQNYQDLSRRLLGLPLSAWNTLILVLVCLGAALFFYLALHKSRRTSRGAPAPLFETAALLILAVFCLSAKMHERYLYPFIPLALGAAAGRRSLRSALMAVLTSIPHFLNVSLIYRLHRTGQPAPDALDTQFLAAAGMTCLALPLWILASSPEPAYQGGPRKPLVLPRRFKDPEGYWPLGQASELKEARRDAIALGILCLLCLGLGFVYFADTRVPEKPWLPRSDESAILDLGQISSVDSISWYSGIGDGRYLISASADGQAFDEPVEISTALWEWKHLAYKRSCRYLKVEAASPAGPLLELALWDAAAKKPLKARAISGTDAPLVDEQAFAAPFATALNSMYFDEIYHGRTAYEHIHALEPYEWTHPPLGKLIISLGIRAFGMNPFGWRIMGMLAGVLLVPLLYALARQAMPRGPWALGCAAAFAFDFMRYTQTRIGTVDVYVVLFVLAAYASMYRFYLSCLDGSARPAAWALALSGLSFSLGAATKWNAVYAGLGLAFLFFIAYFKYALRDRKASVLPKVGVFLLCFASFIILPLAVYAASYIPLLAVPGKTWKSVLDWQGQMLRYHAGLKASHDFASPWWQWPLMIKPVWYFKGDGLAPGMTSTIAAMGNPLIYWFSFAGAAGALYLAYARRDIRVLPLLAGYFSQYLPWALVPRLTFLYHYFPIAPFGLVCIIYCLRPLSLPGPKNPEATAFLREHWIWLYAGACAALFIIFFPAISGLPVPSIWIRLLRWSPSWYF